MRQTSPKVPPPRRTAAMAPPARSAAWPPHHTGTPASQALQRLQRRAGESPQSVAAAALQRQADAALQRIAGLDEDELQGKLAAPVQRANGLEEEEPLQGKAARPLQRQAPATGSGSTRLPAPLRSGIESLSGQNVGDVRVHYNSPAPARVGALAYAQGSDIHVGPGQDRHLPHEAWHTVQQRQGRVQPTGTVAGLPLNDDAGLEREADTMGARAAREGVRQHKDREDQKEG